MCSSTEVMHTNIVHKNFLKWDGLMLVFNPHKLIDHIIPSGWLGSKHQLTSLNHSLQERANRMPLQSLQTWLCQMSVLNLLPVMKSMSCMILACIVQVCNHTKHNMHDLYIEPNKVLFRKMIWVRQDNTTCNHFTFLTHVCTWNKVKVIKQGINLCNRTSYNYAGFLLSVWRKKKGQHWGFCHIRKFISYLHWTIAISTIIDINMPDPLHDLEIHRIFKLGLNFQSSTTFSLSLYCNAAVVLPWNKSLVKINCTTIMHTLTLITFIVLVLVIKLLKCCLATDIGNLQIA